MKNTKIIVFMLLLAGLVLQGCRTNPPDSPNSGSSPGFIIVASNITGASILLDNIPTGKITPATIEASEGAHTIKLEKDGYKPNTRNVTVIAGQTVSVDISLEQVTLQKTVLLEDFANVSCQPCVISNAIIKSLSENTYSSEELVVVKFPTNFPSPSDPFYLANSSACDERIGFYSIFSAPTVIIDGTERPSATDSMSIKQAISQQLNKTPQFLLSVADSINGNTLTSEITIEIIDTAGIDFTKTVIYAAVTEADIEFANPPGSNGETKFYHVFRTMLLDNSGTSLSNMSAPGTHTLNPSVQTDAVWNADKLHTVVYIQNTLTKEIYQAAVSE